MRTKILLLLAIIFCGALAANAQIDKGRFLIGGGFNYNNVKNQPTPDSKFESLNANIQFGKVIKDNNVVGLIISYGYSQGNYYTRINQYSAGVFYRKYKPLIKDLYFFGEVDAAYLYSKNISGNFTSGFDGTRYISNGVSIAFIPGISYAVCKRLQIELIMPNIISLSYSNVKTDYTSSTSPSTTGFKGNTFSFNSNLNSNLLSSFGMGFKFLLGK